MTIFSINNTLYVFFSVIFFIDYLVFKLGMSGRVASWLPELFSLLVLMIVVIQISQKKFFPLSRKYIFLFIILTLNLSAGIIINQTPPGAVISGIRIYLKYIPFFLLPIAYDFSDRQITDQLKIILAILILQCPIALYQRFFQYRHLASGDAIAGSFTSAPALSIIMISAIALIFGLILNNTSNRNYLFPVIALLFIPTAINETKASILLLPLAFIIPFIFSSDKKNKFRVFIYLITVLMTLLICFTLIYGKLYSKRINVVEFYTSDKAQSYLYKGTDSKDIDGENTERDVGRVDAIVYAFEKNSDNLARLLWGVGIGNASVPFSHFLAGNYVEQYLMFGGKQNALAHLIWEVGVTGVALVTVLLCFLFTDTLAVKKSKGLPQALAPGWLGVISIIFICIPYQNIITNDAISYPFWYFSGYMVSKKIYKATDTHPAPMSRGRPERYSRSSTKAIDI